jgi:hypothetical protein
MNTNEHRWRLLGRMFPGRMFLDLMFLDLMFLDLMFLDLMFLDLMFLDLVFLDLVFLDRMFLDRDLIGTRDGRQKPAANSHWRSEFFLYFNAISCAFRPCLGTKCIRQPIRLATQASKHTPIPSVFICVHLWLEILPFPGNPTELMRTLLETKYRNHRRTPVSRGFARSRSPGAGFARANDRNSTTGKGEAASPSNNSGIGLRESHPVS